MSRDPGPPRRFAHIVALILLCTGMAGSGCAAGRAGLQIQDATTARDAALSEGADEAAPYEYTMAHRYLEKAWEEAGHGEYKMSVLLAKKSAEWSDQARVQMQRGKRVLDVQLDDIEDGTPPPAPTMPAPAPTMPAPAPTMPAPAPTMPAPAPEPATPAPAAPAPTMPAPAAPTMPAPADTETPADPPTDAPQAPVPGSVPADDAAPEAP